MLNASGNENIHLEHACSEDLIHWKHLPSAIESANGEMGFLDMGCIFTGCMVEKDNILHAFYTSWNPDNPNGREFIMHATSQDGIRFNKEPNFILAPDGFYYSSSRYRDFRDPNIIYNAEKQCYDMFLLANKQESINKDNSDISNFVFGHYTSKDLYIWTPCEPLGGVEGDECPDYFSIEDIHYIHGCRQYVYSENKFGPYKKAKFWEIDMPYVRAAKTLFDGKRILWFGGWFEGPMSLPRQLTKGDDDILYSCFPQEIKEYFNQEVMVRGTGTLEGEGTLFFNKNDSLANYRTICITKDELSFTLLKVKKEQNATLIIHLSDNARLIFGPNEEYIKIEAYSNVNVKRIQYNPQSFIAELVTDKGTAELILDDKFAISVPIDLSNSICFEFLEKVEIELIQRNHD
jgi:sucrose-6-phosphate hydrolase SacC (GH32 family)